MITVSVPGKIHLMGEHAVVYGHPAFLAAINKRLTVRVSKAPSGLRIKSLESDDYIRHIIAVVTKELKIDALPGIEITVTSEFPAGYHLGSSAAVAAGVIGAVTFFLKKIWNPIAINQLAFEAEKYAHGNPSGADNTAVTFGGFVWYRRELPFLKSIWQLPLKLSSAHNNFYLIDTGKPEETTKEMVELVRSSLVVHRSAFIKLFDENEEQTRRIAIAVKEENEIDMIGAMRKGERTLEAMGVVSPQISSIIRIIELSGGSAKVLGGGGRKGPVGYLLAYHSDSQKLINAVKKYRYPVEKITLGEEGIRLEKNS